MHIIVGSDHAGFPLKQTVVAHLRNAGFEVTDFGTDSDSVPCDYPDVAIELSKVVARGDVERGILVCGSGIGMTIAANKVPGAYAALCHDVVTARFSRLHNNSNILVLGGRMLEEQAAIEMVDVWLSTDFEGGRHFARTQKIQAYERCVANSYSEKKKEELVIFDHPMVQHKIGILRDRNTSVKDFRELVSEIAGLMVYEITRGLPLKMVDVQTPLTETKAYAIAGKKMALVPVLRAGLGMVDGVLSLVPSAKVGHIGLYRNPETLEPVEYYCKLPNDIGERDILILDPMLATGGSASEAIDMIKARGGQKISLVSIIAAPEGVQRVHADHPEVTIYCAAFDSHLDGHGYIIPGLGDAGDRLFGTK